MASAAYHASENKTIKGQVEVVRVALRYHKIHFGKVEHAKLYEQFPNAGKHGSWESVLPVQNAILLKFTERRPLAAKKLMAVLESMKQVEPKPSSAELVEKLNQERAERLTPPEYKEDTDWTAKPYSPPKTAQAVLSEGNDQPQRESSENAATESVETPAAKESTKDTSEKLVAVDDIKLHDVIIWETTTLKKPVTCKVNRLEYGDQGKLIRIFATPIKGEFKRLDISAPLCKLQRMKIKVVRS